ncbi:Uncharacterised protein [Mycobacteroides abscessus subsp. massiliense]|nr:Uncharacterised protein [Mycobacteroides abscessus subsp. massiliense]
MHVLPIARDHHHHYGGDREADPRRHRVGGHPSDGQHQEDFLGRVRHRGQRVRGENR